MFGAIFLTLILLIGIPAGCLVSFFAIIMWCDSRRTRFRSLAVILTCILGYLAAWCYGVSVAIEWWMAAFA